MRIKNMLNAVGMRIGDILLIVFLILTASALLLGTSILSQAGTQAILITADNETILDLHKDTIITINGKQGIRVTVEVKNSSVRFQQSDCPDQICVHSGWLSKSGQSAACLPAGIALRVTDELSDIDAVAG